MNEILLELNPSETTVKNLLDTLQSNGLFSQQHTWCHALIVQAVCNVLDVTIRINESIEGWAPVTVISPISGQKGTTVNIGHLDGRHYVSALQLHYYNDSISGYEISGVINVNNYSEPGNNRLINDGQK